MHLGGTEELWCPFHKWETICMCQYRPTSRPVTLSVANSKRSQNSVAAWRTDSAKKERAKFSLGRHYAYRVLWSRQSELREAEGNTKQFTGFPKTTILAAEGSQPRQIEMCQWYICPQVNFVAGKSSLRNPELPLQEAFGNDRNAQSAHSFPGSACPWVAPGVKSAEAGAFEQRLRTWGDQERKVKAGTIAWECGKRPLAFY